MLTVDALTPRLGTPGFVPLGLVELGFVEPATKFGMVGEAGYAWPYVVEPVAAAFDNVGLVSAELFNAGERLGACVSSANEFELSDAGVKGGSDGSASGLKPPALLLAPS